MSKDFKLQSYYIGEPVKSICKQYAVWGIYNKFHSPLFYIQRPKWITDDEIWKKIVYSIKLDLEKNIVIK